MDTFLLLLCGTLPARLPHTPNIHTCTKTLSILKAVSVGVLKAVSVGV
jgi:hypothetical protein